MPSGGGSSTQQTEPWGGAKPYLKDIYSEADALYDGQPMTPFGGLSVNERLQQASQALGSSPDEIAGAFGLDPAMLQQSIVSQVPALSPYQQQAQQQAVGLAGQGIGPMFGQAQGVVSDAMMGGGATGEAGQFYRDTMGGNTDATGLLSATAGGEYLGSNPHLEGMYEAASRPVIEQFRAEILPGINSSFANVGRTGSPAHQFQVGDRAAGALGRSLTDMSAQLYGGNYEAERGRQQAAAGALGGLQSSAAGNLAGIGGQQLGAAMSAPQLYQAQRQAELGNIGLLEGVGGQQQQTAGQLAGQAAGTYGQINQEPWARLGIYSDLIGGLPSSSMTASRTPYHTNPLAGAAGGALGGYAVGGVPGAAIGGGLGLLGGYF